MCGSSCWVLWTDTNWTWSAVARAPRGTLWFIKNWIDTRNKNEILKIFPLWHLIYALTNIFEEKTFSHVLTFNFLYFFIDPLQDSNIKVSWPLIFVVQSSESNLLRVLPERGQEGSPGGIQDAGRCSGQYYAKKLLRVVQVEKVQNILNWEPLCCRCDGPKSKLVREWGK